MTCKNDHVARPRASTSGGQCAGSVAFSGFKSGDRKPVPDAKAAIIPAVDFLLGLVVPGAVGLQLRNAVHILQGFPSGPSTIPGGKEGLGVAGPGDAGRSDG